MSKLSNFESPTSLRIKKLESIKKEFNEKLYDIYPHMEVFSVSNVKKTINELIDLLIEEQNG